jgi:GAF domain-containing protein
VFRGEFLGSLGLDVIGRQRQFTDNDLKLGMLFANQVATAIANARNYEKSQQRARDMGGIVLRKRLYFPAVFSASS